MTCASCGATIAAKAIVCYRCGRATAVPQPGLAKGASPRAFPVWVLALLVVGALLLGVGQVLPPESEFARVARLAGLALVVLGAFRLIVRRR